MSPWQRGHYNCLLFLELSVYLTQALLLSVRCADVYTCMYIKGQKDPSLLWLSDLTEVGSPMISRVKNDVILGPYLS